VWIGQTTAKRNITFATLLEDFSQIFHKRNITFATVKGLTHVQVEVIHKRSDNLDISELIK